MNGRLGGVIFKSNRVTVTDVDASVDQYIPRLPELLQLLIGVPEGAEDWADDDKVMDYGVSVTDHMQPNTWNLYSKFSESIERDMEKANKSMLFTAVTQQYRLIRTVFELRQKYGIFEDQDEDDEDDSDSDVKKKRNKVAQMRHALLVCKLEMLMARMQKHNLGQKISKRARKKMAPVEVLKTAFKLLNGSFSNRRYTFTDEGEVTEEPNSKYVYPTHAPRGDIDRQEWVDMSWRDTKPLNTIPEGVDANVKMRLEQYVMESVLLPRLIRAWRHSHNMHTIIQHYLDTITGDLDSETSIAFLASCAGEEAQRDDVNAWDKRAFTFLSRHMESSANGVAADIFLYCLHYALIDLTYKMKDQHNKWHAGLAGLLFTSYYSAEQFLLHKFGPGRVLLTQQPYYYQKVFDSGQQAQNMMLHFYENSNQDIKTNFRHLQKQCVEIMQDPSVALHLMCMALHNHPQIRDMIDNQVALSPAMMNEIKKWHSAMQKDMQEGLWMKRHAAIIDYKAPSLEDDPWQNDLLRESSSYTDETTIQTTPDNTIAVQSTSQSSFPVTFPHNSRTLLHTITFAFQSALSLPNAFKYLTIGDYWSDTAYEHVDTLDTDDVYNNINFYGQDIVIDDNGTGEEEYRSHIRAFEERQERQRGVDSHFAAGGQAGEAAAAAKAAEKSRTLRRNALLAGKSAEQQLAEDMACESERIANHLFAKPPFNKMVREGKTYAAIAGKALRLLKFEQQEELIDASVEFSEEILHDVSDDLWDQFEKEITSKFVDVVKYVGKIKNAKNADVEMENLSSRDKMFALERASNGWYHDDEEESESMTEEDHDDSKESESMTDEQRNRNQHKAFMIVKKLKRAIILAENKKRKEVFGNVKDTIARERRAFYEGLKTNHVNFNEEFTYAEPQSFAANAGADAPRQIKDSVMWTRDIILPGVASIANSLSEMVDILSTEQIALLCLRHIIVYFYTTVVMFAEQQKKYFTIHRTDAEQIQALTIVELDYMALIKKHILDNMESDKAEFNIWTSMIYLEKRIARYMQTANDKNQMRYQALYNSELDRILQVLKTRAATSRDWYFTTGRTSGNHDDLMEVEKMERKHEGTLESYWKSVGESLRGILDRGFLERENLIKKVQERFSNFKETRPDPLQILSVLRMEKNTFKENSLEQPYLRMYEEIVQQIPQLQVHGHDDATYYTYKDHGIWHNISVDFADAIDCSKIARIELSARIEEGQQKWMMAATLDDVPKKDVNEALRKAVYFDRYMEYKSRYDNMIKTYLQTWSRRFHNSLYPLLPRDTDKVDQYIIIAEQDLDFQKHLYFLDSYTLQKLFLLKDADYVKQQNILLGGDVTNTEDNTDLASREFVKILYEQPSIFINYQDKQIIGRWNTRDDHIVPDNKLKPEQAEATSATSAKTETVTVELEPVNISPAQKELQEALSRMSFGLSEARALRKEEDVAEALTHMQRVLAARDTAVKLMAANNNLMPKDADADPEVRRKYKETVLHTELRFEFARDMTQSLQSYRTARQALDSNFTGSGLLRAVNKTPAPKPQSLRPAANNANDNAANMQADSTGMQKHDFLRVLQEAETKFSDIWNAYFYKEIQFTIAARIAFVKDEYSQALGYQREVINKFQKGFGKNDAQKGLGFRSQDLVARMRVHYFFRNYLVQYLQNYDKNQQYYREMTTLFNTMLQGFITIVLHLFRAQFEVLEIRGGKEHLQQWQDVNNGVLNLELSLGDADVSFISIKELYDTTSQALFKLRKKLTITDAQAAGISSDAAKAEIKANNVWNALVLLYTGMTSENVKRVMYDHNCLVQFVDATFDIKCHTIERQNEMEKFDYEYRFDWVENLFSSLLDRRAQIKQLANFTGQIIRCLHVSNHSYEIINKMYKQLDHMNQKQSGDDPDDDDDVNSLIQHLPNWVFAEQFQSKWYDWPQIVFILASDIATSYCEGLLCLSEIQLQIETFWNHSQFKESAFKSEQWVVLEDRDTSTEETGWTRNYDTDKSTLTIPQAFKEALQIWTDREIDASETLENLAQSYRCYEKGADKSKLYERKRLQLPHLQQRTHPAASRNVATLKDDISLLESKLKNDNLELPQKQHFESELKRLQDKLDSSTKLTYSQYYYKDSKTLVDKWWNDLLTINASNLDDVRKRASDIESQDKLSRQKQLDEANEFRRHVRAGEWAEKKKAERRQAYENQKRDFQAWERQAKQQSKEDLRAWQRQQEAAAKNKRQPRASFKDLGDEPVDERDKEVTTAETITEEDYEAVANEAEEAKKNKKTNQSEQ